MLRPERMEYVTLLCKNEDASAVTHTLARQKTIHITNHRRETIGSRVIDIGVPAVEAEELSASLITTRQLLAKSKFSKSNHLKRTGVGEEETHNAVDQSTAVADPLFHPVPDLAQRMATVRALGKEFGDHESTIEAAKQRITLIDDKLSILTLLPSLASPIESLFGTKSVMTLLIQQTFLSQKKHKRIDISHLPFSPVIILRNDDARSMLITILRQDEIIARQSLTDEGYAIIDISILSAMRGMAGEITRELLAEKDSLVADVQRAVHAQQTIIAHETMLRETEQVLALELLKAQAPLRFGTTKRITLIKGYVPARRTNELVQALDAQGISYLIDHPEAQSSSETPVLLNNPPAASSFEQLIQLYALPRYDEIDPTNLMAFTFPIFFGFMLGDIGYGLCAFALFLSIKWWAKKNGRVAISQLSGIFILSAISTILFGFIYGEFFGLSSIAGFVLTPLLHRTEDLMLMFGIAILIGAVHINLGLVLGMINESRDGWWFAILKKGSWMLLEVSAVLLAASYGALVGSGIPLLQDIVFDVPAAWTIFGLAVLGIGYSERLKGLLELPMIFSNMLSYVRLVALGLASVYLAFVINQMAGDLFVKGGWWIVFGVCILIFGHTINLALGLLGPFLHSLRLHYVEFFTKFYEGGGKEYKPFGVIEVAR